MAWPVAADVQAYTGITITAQSEINKTAYGLDVDDLLIRAKAKAAEVCGRLPEHGFDEAAVTSEKHDYDGRAHIYVEHPPIVSCSSVVLSDTTLSESDGDYHVYDRYIRLSMASEHGIEVRGPALVLPQAIEISYTGGYSDSDGTHVAIPAALKHHVLQIACFWLLRADEQWRQMKGAVQVTVGQVAEKFAFDPQLEAIHRQLKEGNWAIVGW